MGNSLIDQVEAIINDNIPEEEKLSQLYDLILEQKEVQKRETTTGTQVDWSLIFRGGS